MQNEAKNDSFNDYEIGETLRTSGNAALCAATRRLPGGLARRAVLERQPGCLGAEAQEAFTADMALRLQFSELQLIPQVYDYGFNDAQGAWALWARPGKALSEMTGDNPAPVPAVRQLLGQMLRVFAAFQEQKPPFLYGAVSPENILLMNGGEWVLDGAPVGGAANPWRRPSPTATATTAPEILDVDLGDVTPAADLYALGMSVYQFALGKRLFAQQVPAVFQSPAPGKPQSDLWLAWQASPQLSLPPLEKLLPDFPKDISEIVERLMRKKPEERKVAAQALLDKLNLPVADKVAVANAHDDTGSGGGATAVVKWLGIAIAVLFALAVLSLIFNDSDKNDISLEIEQEHYDTAQASLTVRGKSKNLPNDYTLGVVVKNGLVSSRAFTNPDHATGNFAVEVELSALGDFLGAVGVLDNDSNVVVQRNFTVTRQPPTEITLLVHTYPVAPNAEVTVTVTPAPHAVPKNPKAKSAPPAPGAPAQPLKRTGTTDSKGTFKVTIPYGSYAVALNHPAFLPFQRTFSPGIDGKQTVMLDLTAVSAMEEYRNVVAKESEAQEALKNKLTRLRTAKAAGTITPEDAKELAALEKTAAYIDGSGDGRRKVSREGALGGDDDNAALRQRLSAIDERYQRELDAIGAGPGTAAQKRAMREEVLRRQQKERTEAILGNNPEKRRLLDALDSRYEKERQEILNGPGTPEEKAARIAALNERRKREYDAILTGDANKTERLARLREDFDRKRKALASGRLTPETEAELNRISERHSRERDAIMNGPGTPQEKEAKLRELEKRYHAERAAVLGRNLPADAARRVAAIDDKYAHEREAIMRGPGTPEEKAARLRELEKRYRAERDAAIDQNVPVATVRRLAAIDEKYARERDAIMRGPGTPAEKAARLRELEKRYAEERKAVMREGASGEAARRLAAIDEKYARERDAIMRGPGTPEEKAARLRELEKRHAEERKAAIRKGAPNEAASRLAAIEDKYAREREAILNGPGTPEEKAQKLRELEKRQAQEREEVLAAANKDTIRDLDEQYRNERLAIIEDKADKKKMTVAEFANKRPAPQAALALSANDLASMPLDQLKPHIAALLPAKATDVQINPVINRLTVDGIVLDQENRDILLLRLAPAAARLTVSLRIDPNALVAALRTDLRHEDLEPQMLHPLLIGPQHRLFIGMPANASDDEITKAAIVASQYMASPELTSVSRLPETKDGK